MISEQEFNKAYILHVRRYTDTRVIVDFFTQFHGRISGVFRISKRNLAGLQPFQPVQVSWRGNGDLKTILNCEVDHQKSLALFEKSLYCGFYLNELLQRVLPLDDSYQSLFNAYEQSIHSLSKTDGSEGIESVLRKFEFTLLGEMGFQINFFECALSGLPILENNVYQFTQGKGFTECHHGLTGHKGVISGFDVTQMAQQNYNNPQTLKTAKYITRQSLRPLLGDKPLKSRELFL